jgi:hypothetical protein
MRIGLALGPDRLTVMRLDGKADGPLEVRVRPLEAATDGRWPDLGEALLELKDELGARPAVVSVALLPPLVELKRLDLPPLGRDELERVLARDAGRYFLDASGKKIIATVRLPANGGTKPETLAAAADACLVEQVHREIEGLGWKVSQVAPAHCAWAALSAQASGARHGRGYVAVFGPTSVDLIHVVGPAVLGIRRLPALGSASEIAAQLASLMGASPGEVEQPLVLLLRDPEMRAGVIEALHSHGVLTLPAGRHPFLDAEPDAAAAAFAHAATLSLIPEPVAMEQRRRVRLVTRSALAASVGFLLAAAGLEWLGMQRELDQVADRRAELRGRVVQAMTVRTAVEELAGRLRVLDVAERSARPWSALLGTVATALPNDAHLVGWHAGADSLRVEGRAARATGVFESLQRAPGIGGVRAEAPIQQEVQDSGPPIERFLLGARLESAEPEGGQP